MIVLLFGGERSTRNGPTLINGIGIELTVSNSPFLLFVGFGRFRIGCRWPRRSLPTALFLLFVRRAAKHKTNEMHTRCARNAAQNPVMCHLLSKRNKSSIIFYSVHSNPIASFRSIRLALIDGVCVSGFSTNAWFRTKSDSASSENRKTASATRWATATTKIECILEWCLLLA